MLGLQVSALGSRCRGKIFSILGFEFTSLEIEPLTLMKSYAASTAV